MAWPLKGWTLRHWLQALCLGLFLGLFFWVAWPYGARIHAETLAQKELLPLELFLWLDPLSGLAAAVAGRAWTLSLAGAGLVLALCAWLPRAFCGYVCPLGTLHDLFDWALGRRWTRWRVKEVGGWRHARFYLLAAVLVAAVFGVMLAGFVAAIPVVTRGLMFSGGLLQTGLLKNWGLNGPFTPALGLSLLLFILVLLTGLLSPRFWCRYLCPTGALIALPSLLRLNQRQVKDTCTQCGECAAACPFDAINADISTRPLDCAYCRTCLAVCPAESLFFAQGTRTAAGAGPVIAPPFSRRAWLGSLMVGAGTAVAARVTGASSPRLLRPPGSVAEDRFLDLCVRCGECYKGCPGSALQPAGFDAPFEALWTPVLTPTQAGCHADCNFCTQACPTGAIQPLDLDAKRKFKIGVAVIDPQVCLPHRGERDCQLCYDECEAAGYHAIAMREIKLEVGDVPAGALSPGELEEMSRIKAPFVLADACVGCGLCEYRCHAAVHRQQKLIPRRAVQVVVASS